MARDTIKKPTDIDRFVGMQVRAARRELKLTQDELGKLLNITFQQVQKYERGVNRIASGKLFEIAGVLKRPLEFFYPEQDTEIDVDEARTEALVRSDLQKECKALIDQLSDIDDLRTVKHLIQLAAK